jgi:outer membrane receptor protein involved in Fe transport
MKNLSTRTQRTLHLLAASAAFGPLLVLGLAGTASAQTTPQAAPAERVEVTGSRIRSLSADSPSPLQVISSDDIAKSGAVNIQDLLLKNPISASPAISRTNSNFATASAGVATVNLRNLGESRTLVLINGKRTVSGVPGSSAVDLNNIPTEFIERVEILTGGASSLYGSDAVAGVVNIVFKRSFEGVAADLQVGQSEEGDDRKKKFSLTFGTTGNNGKTSLMGHLAVSEQGAVYSRDRSPSAVDQFSLALRSGAGTRRPEDLFTAARPFFSSFAPQGYFFTDSYDGTNAFTYNRAGQVVREDTNGARGEATGFNRSEFRTIALPIKRALFAAKAEHEFASSHSVFLDGSYAQSKSSTELEPYPLASDDILPASGGQVPAGALVGGVLVRNPLVPDHIWNDISDTDGDGVPDYYFTRRMAEVGNRGSRAERDNFRFVTGVKGDFGAALAYEAFVGYGVTKESQTSSGQVNVLNFRYALDALPDTNDIDGDGNRTEAICRDANARAQGCVPINVFGRGAVSAAALNYVQAPGSLSTSTSQRVAGLSVSGEAFNLPAGTVGYAAGVEYRKENSRSEFDALQQAGLNAGNAIPATRGSFDVSEVFFETRLPLLKNLPFVKQLTGVLAARGSDYSTVGNTTSWNAGLEWAVNSDVKVRLSRTQSTRAPNINELYAPPSQTFPTGLADPCVGVTAASTGVTAERCRAAPGVGANITANGSFRATQADLQGISGFDRGNAALQEEKGRSFTAGIVFTPTGIPALRSLSVTLDYFKIDITDAIVPTPRQFILSQCYSGDASFCRLITRRANAVGPNSAGSISFIDSQDTNGGGEGVEGLDLTASYNLLIGPGRLSTRLAYTWMKEGYEVPAIGAARDNFAGELGTPEHKFAFDLGYEFGNFSIRSTTTYIGKSALDDQFLASSFTPRGRVPAGSVTVPAKTYLDLQFGYRIAKQWQLYAGIDNATGTKAPLIPSGVPGNVTGSETDAGTYDAIGRRYYVGLRANF